jgi:hypothetical protein
MKLLIRDYVGALKERGELDAILPDLLSELGYHVYSRPGIGTTQRGVDVAAVGKDSRGKEKVYLFCVKPGDLTRREWDGDVQKMRPSLNEILDDYIPNRIPAAYRKLPKVIVLCLGGDVHEAVRSQVTAFTKRHTRNKVSFEEWNGDKIAELLLAGILREKVLPKPLQSHFQKAVAMVDQPDVAYEHFARLIYALRQEAKTDNDRVRVARQIYICLWVLFVWARDVDNLDAPYRASELALLNVWYLARPFIGKRTANAKAIVLVVQYLIQLHVSIGSQFLNTKILPHVAKQNALSIAVRSIEFVDVNLKMFEVLGRLALTGHWVLWIFIQSGAQMNSEMGDTLRNIANSGIQLIHNNAALNLPLMDEQAIEVALFLCFAASVGNLDGALRYWLNEMVQRLQLTVNGHGEYPCIFREYRDLLDHPKDRSDEYRKGATAGGVLIPLLAAWMAAFRDHEALKVLVNLTKGPLSHCTLQLWLPETASEDHLYLNDDLHGVALVDLPLTEDGQDLLRIVNDACEKSDGFSKLSAAQLGYFPLILTACRHYRLPVPPQFWISILMPPTAPATAT